MNNDDDNNNNNNNNNNDNKTGSSSINSCNNANDEKNTKEGEYYQQQHGKPYEGMCCLCTMEDITEQDGNYVEYQCYPSLTWKPSLFEASVVQQLLDTQFQQYLTRVKSTDCQAELKRLLKSGPPIYIHDNHGLPLSNSDNDNEKTGEGGGGDTHVCKLWFASDGKERSAKLTNAVEGEERERLWQELKEFIIEVGKEAGDDDDDDDKKIENLVGDR